MKVSELSPPYTHATQKKESFLDKALDFTTAQEWNASDFRAKHEDFASALLQLLNCYAFHFIACVDTFPELKRCYRPTSHSNLAEVLISKIPMKTYFSPPRCGTSTLLHRSVANFWVLHFLLAEGARTFCSFLPADCTARKVLPNAPVVSMGRYTTVRHLCTSNRYQPSSGSNWKTDF